MTVIFSDFRAADAVRMRVQPSQWVQAGIDLKEKTVEEAAALEASGTAWTARAADGRILCCAGISNVFVGRQGVAWAMLAEGLGVLQHLAITRFARAQIAASEMARIESYVAADPAGRCAKWAAAVGLVFKAELECWGADSETVLLFQRIRSCRR